MNAERKTEGLSPIGITSVRLGFRVPSTSATRPGVRVPLAPCNLRPGVRVPKASATKQGKQMKGKHDMMMMCYLFYYGFHARCISMYISLNGKELMYIVTAK
jgi:hypothetical protein